MTTPIQPNPNTQCDKVLEYLKRYGGITQKQAVNDLGILSLTARISQLRKMGWQISTRRDNGATYATFYLTK